MIDIAQRNVNASFGFLRGLAGVKNLGEMLDLQVTYWRNQSAALIGQAEELRAMASGNGSALGIEVDKKIEAPGVPAQIWEIAGDFGGSRLGIRLWRIASKRMRGTPSFAP